ncbi:MAG: hypothetical protein ABIK86_05065 [candidate division WOR-3 bacterium]
MPAARRRVGRLQGLVLGAWGRIEQATARLEPTSREELRRMLAEFLV